MNYAHRAATHALCLPIQAALGVTAGDLAGQLFAIGKPTDSLREIAVTTCWPSLTRKKWQMLMSTGLPLLERGQPVRRWSAFFSFPKGFTTLLAQNL